MITTIVLDIGQVLIRFAWKEYLESFGFAEEVEQKLIKVVFENPVWAEFDRGVWSDAEIIERFCQEAPEREQEIRALFAGKVEQMVPEFSFAAEWVQELKRLGYRVLLLSNFGETLFEKASFSFLPYVDGSIISYRVKCIKPDPNIYRILMETYDVKPEEILFLDDNADNIAGAQKMGWHTVWAVDHPAALQGLHDYGIPSVAGGYTFSELRKIIAKLRRDHGCPWDRKQTHESLKVCMKEEAYEVLEAIDELTDSGDSTHLCEELGDILLQVMMHSQIAEEEGLFTVDHVIQGVSEKMVRRHPHVFGEIQVDSPEAALDTWEQAKQKEQGKSSDPAAEMARVAKSLPALMRAQKVVKKSGRQQQTAVLLDTLERQIQGARARTQAGQVLTEAQIGTILMDCVWLAQNSAVKSEEALIREIEKWIAEASSDR